MRWNDTRGETVEATRAMIDMICDGVVAFFGPEGSCYVEAIVAQSRNIPMISYVSEPQISTISSKLSASRAVSTIFRGAALANSRDSATRSRTHTRAYRQ